MHRYYDAEEIDRYIRKYHLNEIIPDLGGFGREYLSLTRFRKKEIPVWEHDTDKLVFLVEGSVKNCALTENGKKLLLHFSDAFEILRDLELLGIINQSMEIEVARDAVFLEVDVRGIRNILLNNPVFLRAILMQIGRKLAKTTVAQTMTAIYPLESRLSSYIIHMAEKSADGLLVFRDNLIETSELLGTSYRHLLRTLKGFCESGVLVHRGQDYMVADMTALQEKASDRPIYGRFQE